jgi:hypothetical protein
MNTHPQWLRVPAWLLLISESDHNLNFEISQYQVVVGRWNIPRLGTMSLLLISSLTAHRLISVFNDRLLCQRRITCVLIQSLRPHNKHCRYILNSMPDYRFWLFANPIFPQSLCALGIQKTRTCPAPIENTREPFTCATAVCFAQPHSIKEWIWLKSTAQWECTWLVDASPNQLPRQSAFQGSAKPTFDLSNHRSDWQNPC